MKVLPCSPFGGETQPWTRRSRGVNLVKVPRNLGVRPKGWCVWNWGICSQGPVARETTQTEKHHCAGVGQGVIWAGTVKEKTRIREKSGEKDRGGRRAAGV